MLPQTAHRPWPLPEKPWAMAQTWSELLFMHWPLKPEVLRPLIPAALTPDTFDGEAWIAVVPFHMSHVHPRLLPAVPWLSFFPELNVRTYVKAGGKAGVYFFSLEAANPLAVSIARSLYRLPYFNAAMRCQKLPSGEVHYRSDRTHRGAPTAGFSGRYRPVEAVKLTTPGSLEHWFSERYALYTTDRTGGVYRGEIHHVQWPLQRAEADIERNTMTAGHGITLPDVPPLLHYADRIEVAVWPLEGVSQDRQAAG
ncbi:MAG: DUF2071 domain-containing protein [Anaerolineae bacterium]|nr:DUF2071 domain-containing protein [Anaerolineae bacterium]